MRYLDVNDRTDEDFRQRMKNCIAALTKIDDALGLGTSAVSEAQFTEVVMGLVESEDALCRALGEAIAKICAEPITFVHLHSQPTGSKKN